MSAALTHVTRSPSQECACDIYTSFFFLGRDIFDKSCDGIHVHDDVIDILTMVMI